jgi:hypothetical protein
MIKSPPMRHEIKIVVPKMMGTDVRSWLRLNQASFSVQFSPRQVNNIYFDHFNLNRYEENLSGVSARHKVRLRWYGVGIKTVRGSFEVKCKRNTHGWKLSQILGCIIDLDSMSWNEIKVLIQKELKSELLIYFLQANRPVIINTYIREYYHSANGAIRATLDYSQRVYGQQGSTLPNLKFFQPASEECVLEFKADVDHHDQLAKVVDDFPLRVSKNSKYINGISSILDY